MRDYLFLPLEQIVKFEFPVYAHTHETKDKETLQEHTKLCQKYYKQLDQAKTLNEFLDRLAGRLGLDQSETVYRLFLTMYDNVATFHDIGKVNPEFQRVNMEHLVPPQYYVDWLDGSRHSFLSAYAYVNYFMKQIDALISDKTDRKKLYGICLVNGMVISRHHSNLTGMSRFIEEFKPGHKVEMIENGLRQSGYFLHLDIDVKRDKYSGRWTLFQQITESGKELQVGMFLYTRMLYSLLVSCDYYATTEYSDGCAITDFGNTEQNDQFYYAYENTALTRHIRKAAAEVKEIDFQAVTDINQLRTALFLEAETALKKNLTAPVYFLEAPTGSGKSNTAMNLSFQLLQQGYQKIYYVYPFNTLVEQNINILRETFGEDSYEFNRIAVLNSNTPIKCAAAENQDMLGDQYVKALLDRQFLNYPFILTTHVSLFKTMFGHEREALFGFMQLKDSVVILDEIQSYKNDIWSEIIIFLQYFAVYLNMKIIIMSATLPDLSYLCDNSGGVVSLIRNTEAYFSNAKFKDRVRFSCEMMAEGTSLEQLLDHVLNSYDGKKKIVVEFIKRKRAYEFAQMIRDHSEQLQLVLFTGDDNRADRLKKIRQIKESTDGLLLIATQVVEAGVDIDMDIGYKDISKLDSEEQFLGRINRSCKNKEGGVVYFFDLDDAAKIYKDDCRISPELTLKAAAMREILAHKQFSPYYMAVMEHIKVHRNMSRDEAVNIDTFFTEKVGALNFPDISRRMALIDDKREIQSVFLSRTITVDDERLVGEDVWQEYKSLLQDYKMDYAEKQVKLSAVRSKLNYFIYSVSKYASLDYHDQIGDLYKLDNGEDYFVDDILQWEKLESGEIFL